MIFRPEHAEDIISIYLLNQIFETVSDLRKKHQKGYDPYLYLLFVCVHLPILLIKRLRIVAFPLIKLKIKNKK